MPRLRGLPSQCACSCAHPQVYPLPFIDRISEEARDQEWDAVWLENEHVRLMVLPQLGGRIHVMQVSCSSNKSCGMSSELAAGRRQKIPHPRDAGEGSCMLRESII